MRAKILKLVVHIFGVDPDGDGILGAYKGLPCPLLFATLLHS